MFASPKTDSVTDTSYGGTTRSNSVAMPQLHTSASQQTILKTQRNQHQPMLLTRFFNRLLNLHDSHGSILPRFADLTDTSTHKSSSSDSSPPGFSAHAWAADTSRVSETDGVHVVHEVHQNREDRGLGAGGKTADEDWA
jgi:hypothetical protein